MSLIKKQLKFLDTSIIKNLIFFLTIIVGLLTLIPSLFPALLLRTFSELEDTIGINPFEIGIWTYSILATNFILLGLCILYFKNILPQPIKKSINFIFNFEISPKVAFFVVVILLGIYITSSVNEILNEHFMPDFFKYVKNRVDNFSITEVKFLAGTHLMDFLIYTSVNVFDNYKVTPYLASISLIVLTYFITFEITKKRFAGIVAMVIILQSTVFLRYDSVVAYPNFWILFYLLSLFLILKKWPLSPISYIVSIFTKALSAAFLPFTLFFIFRANMSKQKKKHLLISYGLVVGAGMVFLLIVGSTLIGSRRVETFDFHDFVSGFNSFNISFHSDGIFLLFLLPLIVGLFIASKKRIIHADTFMFFIFGMLLSAPFLGAFSELQNMPYRFIPFIVFFAIGVGILLSKQIPEKEKNILDVT